MTIRVASSVSGQRGQAPTGARRPDPLTTSSLSEAKDLNRTASGTSPESPTHAASAEAIPSLIRYPRFVILASRMPFEITTTRTFAAAHQLRLPDGSLEPLHGRRVYAET